jgi:hypothetical protein
MPLSESPRFIEDLFEASAAVMSSPVEGTAAGVRP